MGSAGFLQGLSGQFGKLFTPAKSGKGKPGREAEAKSTIDSAEDSYRFEQKVRKLLTRAAGKRGGSLHYIGITKVRAFYGPRWTGMAEKVHGVAHEAVKRRLGEYDLYAQHGEDGYIVVFADSSKEAAKLKCGLMAQEMSKRLFGSDDCAHLEMATIDIDKAGRITAEAVRMGQISDTIAGHQKAAGAATEVDAPNPGSPAGQAAAAAHAEGSARGESAAQAASGAQRSAPGASASAHRQSPLATASAAAAASRSGSGTASTASSKTSTAGSSASAAAASASTRAPAARPTPARAAVRPTTSSTNSTSGTQDALGALAERRATPDANADGSAAKPGEKTTERGRLAIAAKTTESLSDGRLRFVYRPLWFIQRKVIMGYVCVPCRVTAENVVLFGGAAMPVSMASPENAALDRLTIKRVITDLKDLMALDQKSVLVAPVHHLTVSNPNSRRILADVFADASEELRGLIVFELMGVPEDVSAKDMSWATETLKPYSKAVFVRRRLESLSIPVLREAGIYGTGAEIGNYSATERTIIPAMSKFVDLADQAGLATYIHGLRTVSLVSAAMGAGFDYIDGDPIAAIDEAPNCIFPFGLRNLYQSVMDSPT